LCFKEPPTRLLDGAYRRLPRVKCFNVTTMRKFQCTNNIIVLLNNFRIYLAILVTIRWTTLVLNIQILVKIQMNLKTQIQNKWSMSRTHLNTFRCKKMKWYYWNDMGRNNNIILIKVTIHVVIEWRLSWNQEITQCKNCVYTIHKVYSH